MRTEDYSVTGLAQKNLQDRMDRDEQVVAATIPTRSTEVIDVISGFTHVQFVTTNSGKLLLMGYEAEGGLTVIQMNAFA